MGQDGCPSKRIYNKQTVGHFILKEEILSSTGPTQGAWIIIGNKGPTFLKDIQNHDNFSRACEFHDIKRVLDEEGNVLVEYEKDRPECLKSTDGPSESSIIAGITNCHTYVDDGDKTTVKSEEEFTISACDLLYEDAHCPCGNLITADHVPDQCQIVSNGHSMGDINPSMKRSADAAIPTKEKKRKSSKFTTETEKTKIERHLQQAAVLVRGSEDVIASISKSVSSKMPDQPGDNATDRAYETIEEQNKAVDETAAVAYASINKDQAQNTTTSTLNYETIDSLPGGTGNEQWLARTVFSKLEGLRRSQRPKKLRANELPGE